MYIDNEKSPSTNSMKVSMSWEYVRDHVYLFIRRITEDRAVKKPFLNVEICMKITVDSKITISTFDESISIVVDAALINALGVSEEDVWTAASENSRKDATIRSFSEWFAMPSEDSMMYFATNGQGTGGACVLIFLDLFRKFCKQHDESTAYILPSSTEEVIVLKGSDVHQHMSVDDLAQLVKTVNAQEVPDEIALEPVAYQYSYADNSIRVAAVAY